MKPTQQKSGQCISVAHAHSSVYKEFQASHLKHEKTPNAQEHIVFWPVQCYQKYDAIKF